ncbi:MAG: redoxin domain-containing protein [Verrucomicrobia bacterium]|nr:redoxin domain-containing protein [Verrucomicrobiota bacterium]
MSLRMVIPGAGMAGVSAGRLFADRGHGVILLEESRLKRHAKFMKEHGLPFPLLSDEARAIVQASGVWVEKSMQGKKCMDTERSTMIIGPDGKVKAVLRKVQPAKHWDLVLQALGWAAPVAGTAVATGNP